MSEYGRLWQQCADIRGQLKKIAPTFHTNTVSDGYQWLLDHKADLSSADFDRARDLLDRWARLELRMKDVNA